MFIFIYFHGKGMFDIDVLILPKKFVAIFTGSNSKKKKQKLSNK